MNINTDTQTSLANSLFSLSSIKEMEEAIKQKKSELAENFFDFICKMTKVKVNDVVQIELKKPFFGKKTVCAFVKGCNISGGFDLRPFDMDKEKLFLHSFEFSDLNSEVGNKGFIIGSPVDYTTQKGDSELILRNGKLEEAFNEIPKSLLDSALEIVQKGENTFHNPDVIKPIGRLDFDRMVFINYETGEEKAFLKSF